MRFYTEHATPSFLYVACCSRELTFIRVDRTSLFLPHVQWKQFSLKISVTTFGHTKARGKKSKHRYIYTPISLLILQTIQAGDWDNRLYETLIFEQGEIKDEKPVSAHSLLHGENIGALMRGVGGYEAKPGAVPNKGISMQGSREWRQ